MKSIKLVYWRTVIDNYGDLLSPYIIQKLSGCQIIHKNFFVGNWRSHVYHYIKEIVHLNFSLRCDYLFPIENNIVGIGSILFSGNRKSKIWGSGFMAESERCTGGKIYAIRGYCSLDIIKKQIQDGVQIKLAKNMAIGDPALLLPLLIPAKEKKQIIGIVPHFSELDYFKELCGDKFHVIDLRSSDIEDVTHAITSCERILSTSLHGLIVAHAYGIPALWMEHTGLESGTRGFKFYDYFSSVHIPEYPPIKNVVEILQNEQSVIKCFEKNKGISLPHVDMKDLQDSLLDSTPFRKIKH